MSAGAGGLMNEGIGEPSADQVELAHWLFDRARAGEAERLAAYVDAGVPADLTDAAGNTLLMLAAYHGHPGVVSVLIDRGADVDVINDRGQTPLAGAVFKGYPDVVAILVAAGADPDLGSPTARAAAVFFDRPDLARLLDRRTQC
jgi:ankyrin repeat protein